MLTKDGQLPDQKAIAPRLRSRGGAYQRRVKPAADVVLAVLLMMLTAPLLVLVSFAIILDSGRPVLFRQERVGQFGVRFRVIRFRTVDVASELWRRTLALEPVEPSWDQPGMTRIGRLLLRTRLDRLPELINVVRGQMSLVGPRPPMPFELAEYGPVDWVRLRVRPGITGLWQVTRGSEGFGESMREDQAYVRQMSARLDAQILLRTLRLVAGRFGSR